MITATCGHEIKHTGRPVAVKSWYKDNIHVINWDVLCPSCRKEYEKDGLILKTREEQIEWLRGRDG